MPKNSSGMQAQLHSASGRSSKILRDAASIEAVVDVPGRGRLTLSVQSGGGYSLRVHMSPEERRFEAAGRDLVTVGVLGTEEVVSLTPG